MSLELLLAEKEDLAQYKADMQEAFQLGAMEGGYPEDVGEILPEADINRSLAAKGAVVYKAVSDGKMVGGAIIVIDEEKQCGHLDFLYVKHGIQGKGIGKFIWFEIERRHSDITSWETCTPYFERRNIHFYINVCKFQAVEFFHDHHKDPNEPQDFYDTEDFAMFKFVKNIAI